MESHAKLKHQLVLQTTAKMEVFVLTVTVYGDVIARQVT